MIRAVRSLLAPLIWRLRGGDGQVQALVTCAHPPGSWSYCTGGYRYCLRCMKVRVRC